MSNHLYQYLPDKISFISKTASRYRTIYMPLCGPQGTNLKSSITPRLSGDIKIDKLCYLTKPVSTQDLRQPLRNIYIQSKDKPLLIFSEDCENSTTTVDAGQLWHRVTREYPDYGLEIMTLNFIPSNGDDVELMLVRVQNISDKPVEFQSTIAIPLFARALANKHDHEHVTSLLNRIRQTPEGVVVSPTMSFDEEGHRPCDSVFYVYGTASDGNDPVGSYPTIQNFYEDNGHALAPQALLKNKDPRLLVKSALNGQEAMGALKFKKQTLKPDEAIEYIVGVGVENDEKQTHLTFQRYNTPIKVRQSLETTQKYWAKKSHSIKFETKDENFNSWMQWVTLQPVLRRIFGCSFLPDHDYGKGGKGWRDIWQDLLSLILIEPEQVRNHLINNFAGVRIDGSNATIIGEKPGEFLADRNSITRVWMDHGVWPFETILLYINQTGDFDILFEKNSYFCDPQILRTYQKDYGWSPEDGNQLKDGNGEVYYGTILEHILLQNLVQFFNVGEHNITRLESADWNDGLDMGFDRGESVAFASFYAGNLMSLVDLLETIKEKTTVESITIFKELKILLDTIDSEHICLYEDVVAKKNRLFKQYCPTVQPVISGETEDVLIDDVVSDLRKKATWMIDHIRNQERLEVEDEQQNKLSWYNGYYDNQGKRVEGLFSRHTRMTLTGQVFPIMHGVATDEDCQNMVQAVNQYLKDPNFGGIRLNSDFQIDHYLDLGRAFGFAYGTKENGAVFSHMTVMYAFALYKRGFAKEGYDVIHSLYSMAMETEHSQVYPGIPEYFDSNGKGMYHYLTGSASWLVLLQLTQVFGVRGLNGDLLISPKLLLNQFDSEGQAKISSTFAGTKLKVIYDNLSGKEYGEYKIISVLLNGEMVQHQKISDAQVVIPRDLIQDKSEETTILVRLD